MQPSPISDLLLPPGCVLLAAGFDWLESLLPFAFVAIWLLSQVFAVFRRLQGNGGNPRRPPAPRFDPGRQRPPPLPPAGDAGGGDPRSVLEKQIADFLREATGETGPRPQRSTPRGEPVRRGSAGAGRPQASFRGESPPRRKDRPAGDKTPAARDGKAGGSDLAARPQVDQEVSVARHVQDAFARELTHLRGEIKEGDPLGAPGPASAARVQADELVHLLRSPATIRQVMLLREVLDRPVQRW